MEQSGAHSRGLAGDRSLGCCTSVPSSPDGGAAQWPGLSGPTGALTLFSKKAVEYHLFGEHVSGSETYVTTFGHGRQAQEWRQRPERPDNHWFDCLVGSAAAASMLGVQVPGAQSQERRQRKRYTQADLVAKEWRRR